MLFSEPQVGIEPTTYSLRENRSATELLRLCVEPCAGFEPACACASWLQVKRSRPLSQHGSCWSGRIRTYESRMAADLQSAVVDHCTTLQFFFCFVEKSRIELLTTKFSVWHSTTELLLHFFLLPHKDSNLDNSGSEPLALPIML